MRSTLGGVVTAGRTPGHGSPAALRPAAWLGHCEHPGEGVVMRAAAEGRVARRTKVVVAVHVVGVCLQEGTVAAVRLGP